MGCQPRHGGNVVDDRGRHVGEADDAAKVLEGLEQNQERQAWPGLARLLPRKGEFGQLRRERLQLGRGRVRRQPRVGGICDDRHGRGCWVR